MNTKLIKNLTQRLILYIITIITIILWRIKSNITTDILLYQTISKITRKPIKTNILTYQEQLKNTYYTLVKTYKTIKLWIINIIKINIIQIILVWISFCYLLLLIFYITYQYRYHTNLSLEMETRLTIDTYNELISLINETNRFHDLSTLNWFDSLLENNKDLAKPNLLNLPFFELMDNNQLNIYNKYKINNLFDKLNITNYKDYLYFNNENYWHNLSILDPTQWKERYNNSEVLYNICSNNPSLEVKLRSLIQQSILNDQNKEFYDIINYRNEILFKTLFLSLTTIASIFGVIFLNSAIIIN